MSVRDGDEVKWFRVGSVRGITGQLLGRTVRLRLWITHVKTGVKKSVLC